MSGRRFSDADLSRSAVVTTTADRPPAGTVPGRTALILSGGGALGAYEVGVLKALTSGAAAGDHPRPFDPDLLLGTSVGAFNATFLAARKDVSLAEAVARLEEVWLERIADRGGGNGVFRYRLDPRRLADPLRWCRRPRRTWLRLAEDLRSLSQSAARCALPALYFRVSNSR